MSCPNATSPIDISLSKITGNCEYKCDYSFSYNNSSCVAINRGDYLSLSYDKPTSPPVIYNAVGYYVDEIRIYTPSLHSYSGSKTAGEMIIVHSSNTGSSPLLVCIPIQANNTSSESAAFFRTLIDTVANSAPSDGETTTVNIKNYNLNVLVPRKPFFSYTATEPYQPCSTGSVDYIVFDPLNISLDMGQESLQKFQSIIQKNFYNVVSGPSLFYNKKGSIRGGAASGNEIYIDCQPVGTGDETVDIITEMGGTTPYPSSIEDWLKNPIVKLFLGSLIFIIILFVIKTAIDVIKPSKGEQMTGGRFFR